MTVKEQMKADLLRYPSIIKNKWSCYHQWFAITGNGLEWVNGELVDKFEEHNSLTLNEALDNAFDSFTEDSVRMIEDYTILLDDAKMIIDDNCDTLEEDLKQDTINDTKRELSLFKNKIKSLINYQHRMNDFTQSEDFFPLTNKSIICCLPDEGINDDWKEACKEFYGWLISNYDSLDEQSKENLVKINTSWLKQEWSVVTT